MIDFGEDAVLTQEDTVEGQGYMRQYSVVTSAVYVMVMNQELLCDDMIMEMTQPEKTVLIQNAGGVTERKVYKSVIDNMAVDMAVIHHNGCSIILMLMSEKVTYEGANQVEWMNGWLEQMTVDGEVLVTDIAAAIDATAAVMANATPEPEEQLIAIPKVSISFGGEGVLIDENSVENACMQTYAVGDRFNVYVMEYLGEYLCDGVWQSIAFELPENATLWENQYGIRERKTYDYAAYGYTGDVTVVHYNGCTIALVVSVDNETYAAGLQEEITGWLKTMTIDGMPVYTEAE